MVMSSNRAVYAVPGVGSRRENQSWNTLRDNWSKAGINGRRLKTVLDLLELEPKRALQETERLIKKFGGNGPFWACKAIAMARLQENKNKFDASLTETIQRVLSAPELDELTVSCLVHLFQHELCDYISLHRFFQRLIPEVRSNAVMLEMMLMVYFRHHNFKEMQRIALELTKCDVQNADKHALLAILSLIMQSMDCLDAGKRKGMLNLAYKTLDKRFPALTVPTQEFAMKLWILLQMGDLVEFRRVFHLAYPGGFPDAFGIFPYHALVIGYCRLLAESGQKAEAGSITSLLPEGNCDVEDVKLVVFVRLQLFLEKLKDSTTDFATNLSQTLDELRSFLEKRVDSTAFLIIVQLKFLQGLYEEIRLERTSDLLGSLIQRDIVRLLVEYFVLTGDRTCFYTDIQEFLLLLTPDSIHTFISSLPDAENVLGVAGTPKFTLPNIIRLQNRSVLVFALREDSEHHPEAWTGFLDQLLSLRARTIQTYAAKREQSENVVHACVDISACLSVHVLFAMYKKLGDSRFLLDAIVLLQALLDKPKHLCNPYFRILLVQAFIECGAFNLIMQQLRSLDIKSLQLQHLGMLAEPLMLMSVPADSAAVLDDLVRFFVGNIFELFEAQAGCINKDDFNQVIHLEMLKKNLKYSSSYALAAYARLWNTPLSRFVSDLEAAKWGMDMERFVDPSASDLLHVNNDSHVVPSWNLSLERLERDMASSGMTQVEQITWISVLKSQMALYGQCVTLASTYSRYNPFCESKCLKDQLLEQMLPSQADVAGDAISAVAITYNTYFDDFKALSNIPFSKPPEHISATFPRPHTFYRLLGCQGVHLRLAHFVTAVERVLSASVKQYGGKAAYSVDDSETNGNQGATPAEEPFSAQQKDIATNFGEAVHSCELSSKFRQMIFMTFEEFQQESPPSNLTRYRDLLMKVWLTLQAMRCVTWTVSCLSKSITSLYGSNESRKDAGGKLTAKAAEYRKVLDDWLGEWYNFLDDLRGAIKELSDRMHIELSKVTSKETPDWLTPHPHILTQLQLAPDEPQNLEAFASAISCNLLKSWQSLFDNAISVSESCSSTLADCMEESKPRSSKSKTKVVQEKASSS